MKLHDLIGYQIVKLSDVEMQVCKDSNTYTILFDCDHGDCCGFADINNTLLFDPENSKENPVITKVELSDDESEYGSQSVVITFFGEYKPLAKLSAVAGSGSGWMYGATVTAICKPLDMTEEVVGW